MKTFQVVILGVFGFFAVVGVIMFAMFRGPGASQEELVMTLWGTVPSEVLNEALDAYNNEAPSSDNITLLYREFRQDVFNTELVEALAEGRGPDAILLAQGDILKHKAKVVALPFESFPERTFKDLFIELGEIYVTSDGIVGFPFLVDPLVLYWNRDLLASSGIALPPKTWEELVSVVDRLTKRDAQNNILKSAVALGEFQNITHAKSILTLLFLQAGDPIVRQGSGGALEVTLGDRLGLPEVPAESVLRFYTEFANPVKALYSWNRSLPFSKESFLAGDTAIYLGFASEANELTARNPNLNFDIAMVPQIAGVDVKKTYGSMHAIAMMRNSSNLNNGFRAATLMTSRTFIEALAETSGLPPVRRDMLLEPAPDARAQVFYNAALIADAFLDPDQNKSSDVFSRMVGDVTAGRESIIESIARARGALTVLLP